MIPIAVLFLSLPIMAQEFPELLLEEDDPPPLFEKMPAGTFVRIDGDWILCRGPLGQGDGPPGPNFRLDYRGRAYTSIAVFNNEAVQLALQGATNPGALIEAEAMWKAGYADDPHFFAFNYNLARVSVLKRDFRQALFFAERSAAMMKKDYRLDLLLASLYERLQEDVAAQLHYREAVRKNPFSATALVALAGYYARTERESLAEDLLRRGMDRFETDRQLRLGLAELRFRQYRLNQARILVESIDVARTDRSSFALRRLLLMARLYDRIGDYRRATSSYDELLASTTEPFFLDQSIEALRRERSRVERLSKVD